MRFCIRRRLQKTRAARVARHAADLAVRRYFRAQLMKAPPLTAPSSRMVAYERVIADLRADQVRGELQTLAEYCERVGR